MKARVLRLPLLGGRLVYLPGREGSALTPGEAVFATHLWATVRDAEGNIRERRDLGDGLVTHDGVRLLSQDTAITAGTAALAACKYHGTGTGTTAAAATDTALQTAIGTTATAGTNTNADSSPNATATSVATVAYSGTLAVTEWGLFNSDTLAGAKMFDHKVFAAINVNDGDSIQFTYTLTLTSGG